MRMWLILPLLVILTSCVEDKKTPESALKSFVEEQIGKVVTKNFVMDRVTGKMAAIIESMPEEDFQKFADLRNVERTSFKILSKSCQEKKCFLTYSIAYKTDKLDKKDAVSPFATEVKKIAEILSVEGKWLIADVSNIKTYHEALEPISPLE